MEPGDYLRRWSLRNVRKLADTPTCTVFKVEYYGGPAVLKLLKPESLKDEGESAYALAYFDGLGSVRLLRADTHAQLLSYADGPFLGELSASGRDWEATIIACNVISRLHSPRETPLPRLKILSDLFSNFISWALLEDGELWRRSAGIARELLLSEKEKVVLHGDIHHKNIIGTTSGDWLAIDPKAYLGERTFDLANFLQPRLLAAVDGIAQQNRGIGGAIRTGTQS